MTGNFYYLKSKKKYICRDNISFKQLVKKLNNSSPYLFQIVLDKNNKFLGTITDGDLRKFIINNNFDNTSKINKMINKNANVGKDGKDNFNKDKLNKFLSISKKKTDFLPIVDKKNFLTDILIFDNQNYHNNFACFILAGGRGERLKPLSNKIPKPLIKIKNKSLIEIIILKLSKINIMKFYISVNYKKNLIINALSQNKYKNLNINFVSEKLKLGTAGSLSLIKNTESENILIFNSDILTDLDITKLINFYQENNFDFLIGAATINYSIPFGLIEDIDGKVLEISEKPNKQYKILSGIYILKKNMLKHIKKDKYLDMPDLINLLIQKKFKIGVFPIYEKWLDVGSHESLSKAKSFF